MTITIPELGFELRPYEQGPCWQLYEHVTNRVGKDGAKLPDVWRSCGVYPSTLEHGILLIRERAARRSKVSLELAAVLHELRKMDDAIHMAVAGSLGRSERR